MPLRRLKCPFRPKQDAEVLRSLKDLRTINGKRVSEIWKGASKGR